MILEILPSAFADLATGRATDLDHDELMELKELLISHFSQKAIDEAGNIWAKKKLSEKTMDDWLNEE